MRIKLKQSIVVGGKCHRLDKGRVYPATKHGSFKQFKKHGFCTVYYGDNNHTILTKGEYVETLKL
jgi:hypothetical protein